MLVPLTNVPRNYDWGSRDAIARLQGREASGAPEAEVWFGDHPGAPALVGDGSGRTLDAWISEEGAARGFTTSLPYLLKLLAAKSPLSIQAHPTLEQARAGYESEEAAGVPRDAAHRNYRDANHKPEVIVAIDRDFEALAGFRPVGELAEILDALGVEDPDVRRLRDALDGTEDDARRAITTFVGALLGGDVGGAPALIAATAAANASRFAEDFAALRRIEEAYPGDPGVVVALLMNRIVLAEGQALFVPAGVPHAYLRGLGVEIMAASDNVLRGGLTPKHVDVPELLSVLDASPGRIALLTPVVEAPGVEVFAPPVSDFSLVRVRRKDAAEGESRVELLGATIALATRGRPTIVGSTASVALAPGEACLITPDEGAVRIAGTGEVFLARSGRAASV
ncbi:mannose-6-phosphate isomerase, class I [Microbacterium sp. CJ77]|uniref:mannose-6-phosphate isomerase, class I n=1 Tax=Microbacterium sp. CJ77 TaxID=2079201 RepID=UPI000CD90A88|nr:mannose-6-phosphate isomerase, class I [Microbacterium sp. CJ77]